MSIRFVPTNGHPTRKAAIIELYEQRVPQKEIAARLNCNRNVVSHAIHDYRQKTGRFIDPVGHVPRAPSIAPDAFGSAFSFGMRSYLKSIEGARKALEAMRQ